MKQWFKYLLINPLATLLLIGFLVLLTIALLTLSSTGTRILANNAKYFVSGLTLEGAEGALVSGLTLKHLQWKDDATQVDASQISLDNTLDIGVPSTLVVKSLHADKLVIRLLASADGKESTPFKPPTLFLPFNIDARNVDIGELEIWRGDTPLRFHHVKLIGHTLDGRLQVESLRLDGVMGQLAVDGVVGWQDAITWQANVTGTHINPVDYLKDMPASLDVALTSSGTWAQGKTQVLLDISKLQGRLREYPVDVKGQAEWDGKLLALHKVNALIGNNQLQAEGNVGESFDLHWRVDAKNLATAWMGLEGSLKGAGVLKGKLNKPEIQADLKGSKLRYQDFRLGSLDVQASQAGEIYTVKGNVQDFKAGNTVIPSAQIDAQGTLENHRVTAKVTHPEGKADFVANGGLKDGQWRGTVQSLSLRDTAAGDWNMAGAVKLDASANVFSSSEICLTDRGARACGKPVWSQQNGFSLTGTLQQIPLVMLRPWLPDTFNAGGAVSADYHFEQRGGKPTGKVDLRLPDNSFTVQAGNGKAETLHYTNARANLSLNDRQLEGQAQLDLSGYGQLRADGRVDLSPQDGNHRINAHLTADMPDIAWLERYSTQIDQLQGRMNGDVQITGSLKKPNVTGSARLTNGQVHLPEAGVTLDAISLTMQASGADRAVITGSMRAGQGVLNANGVLSLANLPNWRADVNLQGNNLKLMDTHEVQALVSPNLQFQISPASVAVSGTVLIPESTVSLREIPQTASTVSEDVVIVGRRAPHRQAVAVSVKEAPLDIQPNVTIELGDRVKFTGFGLDARLNGKLRVLRTRQDIVAEGVLNVVDGVYKAYGQNLAIERGRLIFNGPLDNPGLDVRAVREVEEGDIKVGIALAGTVQQPESTLFSTPQQTQSDTLSYLLTGRAMSGLSGDQSSLLMEAVSQLGVVGGESLVQQIGGSLGLDELGLKTKNGDFGQSELALGKRLGARLYVRYIVSLFDSLQRVAITYQINKHLQLEAKAGVNQGIDLIYKIDTNKGLLGP
ncbi:MAG: translocation/assembly module TamB domain-containing protein [Thiothrix sp.]|uniref:translocation/assembly module TamB domain-containing protein n=1 Tax=Thiothrix sp. TaxID=1032 RepID=UPI002632F331|nr:translocation/assembly module TamB domain-containing protein [Thiothrix sp.]MDD5393394.1 translocation/assembly module TamB domain-containing protein [Thiothrix sp.]